MSFITVAAATIPSMPLDFKGNRDRILDGIRLANKENVKILVFGELAIPGYGCLGE
jgi:NAD+ synthase (glutamine-hydrolysing)